MKKKILLVAMLVAVIACLFAISISAADPSYKDGEWIYAADGVTKLAIRDTEGNPLIWYMNGTELKYVRADQTDTSKDVYVKYNISATSLSGFNGVPEAPTACLKDIDIYDNGTAIEGASINSQIVLFNMERLEIDAINGWLFGNKNGCCTLMRGLVFPSTLKYIGQEGFTNTRIVQYWNLENTQLVYINACNFASASTLTQEATNGVFICPRTLARPLEVQGAQIRVYVMNPYFDYKINVQWNQFFRNCKQLQEIYCPAQTSMGFGDEAFRDTPGQYIVFLTGTKEEAESLINNTVSSHNSIMKGAKAISYAEYLADKDTYDNATNQAYVVYGYNFCDAFYGGNHDNVEGYNFTSFTESAFVGVKCQRPECGASTVDTTYEPVIVISGFSVPLYSGAKGMAFSYTINAEALKAYVENTGDTVSFGFIVATGANLANGVNIMESSLKSDFAVIEIVLNYGDIAGVDDIDVVMACKVTAEDKDGNVKTSYYQPATDKVTTDYAYGDVTLYGASYNDLSAEVTE